MSEPSQSVIEAIGQAEREHIRHIIGDPCSCGYDGPLWHWQHVRAEVARAAETAALRAAAERMDDLSRGAKRLTQWADELTDTNERSK